MVINLGRAENNALRVCPEEHHTSFTGEYTADGAGAISATAIISPTSGKKIAVHGLAMETDAAAGTIDLDFSTSSIKVARMYPSKNTATAHAQAHDDGAIDEALTLTAASIGNGSKVLVKVQYVEET